MAGKRAAIQAAVGVRGWFFGDSSRLPAYGGLKPPRPGEGGGGFLIPTFRVVGSLLPKCLQGFQVFIRTAYIKAFAVDDQTQEPVLLAQAIKGGG